MKVVQASDLHGHWNFLLDAEQEIQECDVVILTGDMLPDIVGIGPVTHKQQQQFQFEWVKRNPNVQRVMSLLATKPVVVVNGNHDYINLANYIPNSLHVTHLRPQVVNGIKFAGFEGMPKCGYGFNEEITEGEAERRARQALRSKPDIFLTHVPPFGVLDEGKFGFRSLRGLVDDHPELVTYRFHFFGHCHRDGGQVAMHGGSVYVNGSCRVTTLDISLDKLPSKS